MFKMDYIIIGLLVSLMIYLIVRDFVVAKKRKKNHVMLKRISTKQDQLSKEYRKQSGLFNRLLIILSKDEDED